LFNKVLICDNLALPFREESFDAVLSIAVVHHFATTERRVHALKELARVLRIGGRLVISVWAMEQKHRKVRMDFSSILLFLLRDDSLGSSSFWIDRVITILDFRSSNRKMS
jgi:ubiquinone/menaquinone biosynthesis C-methylase UbiE